MRVRFFAATAFLMVAAAAAAFMIAASGFFSPLRAQTGDPLEEAVSAEMQRAVHSLNEKDYPNIYYVGLSVTDYDSWEETCQMGAAGAYVETRRRLALPDI